MNLKMANFDLSPALALALKSIEGVGAGRPLGEVGLLPLHVLCQHVPACIGDASIIVELALKAAPEGSESQEYMFDAKMSLATDAMSDYGISLHNAALAAKEEGEAMIERLALNCLGAMYPAVLSQRPPMAWEAHAA